LAFPENNGENVFSRNRATIYNIVQRVDSQIELFKTCQASKQKIFQDNSESRERERERDLAFGCSSSAYNFTCVFEMFFPSSKLSNFQDPFDVSKKMRKLHGFKWFMQLDAISCTSTFFAGNWGRKRFYFMEFFSNMFYYS